MKTRRINYSADLETYGGKSPAPEQSVVEQTHLSGGLIPQYPQKMKTRMKSRKRGRQIKERKRGEMIDGYGKIDQLNTGTLAK